MNWLSVQFWLSMPSWIHSLSPHFANGVPWRSIISDSAPRPPNWAALASTTSVWSTTVSHGRSVSPFHCECLAFS